jgi:hypothetical protein
VAQVSAWQTCPDWGLRLSVQQLTSRVRATRVSQEDRVPKTNSGGPGGRLGAWLVGVAGAVVIALATAWGQHWIGPPRSPPEETSTYQPRSSSPGVIRAEDITGKWLYPDGSHYWVIRPGSSGKYTIEYYTSDARQVGEGEGQLVGDAFHFTLNASNHMTGETMNLVPQTLNGQLRLADGRLSGPTDEYSFEILETDDPSIVPTLTLTRP